MNAHINFKKHRQNIDRQLALLKIELLRLDDRERTDVTNWEYTGTAQHVSEKLKELLDGLATIR